MKRIGKQAGFSLITAIFLLIVVAGLIVYMTNIRVVQQNTSLYGIQGARAINAARSGIEWGTYEVMVGTPGACFASPTNLTIEGFSVSIACGSTTHREGVTDVITYQLTSTATSGTFPSLDFVQRQIQARVSISPP